jgi:hypothetical protein
MSKPSRMRKYVRIINRLGISSLFLGVVAAVVKTWVTYYLGPPQTGIAAPLVQPVQTQTVQSQQPHAQPLPAHVGQSHGEKQVAVVTSPQPPLTVEDLLNQSPISLMRWQEMVEHSTGTGPEHERLFRPYLGKEVVWEGFYDQSHVVESPTDDAHACTLILHESRGTLFNKPVLGPPFIRCWIPKQKAEELKTLQRGDWVVVRGRINDAMLAGSRLCTDLDQCEIIARSAVRSVETALPPLSESTVVR